MVDFDQQMPTIEESFRFCPSDTIVQKERHTLNMTSFDSLLTALKELHAFFEKTVDHTLNGRDTYSMIDRLQQIRHDMVHVMIADTLHVVTQETPIKDSLMSDLFIECAENEDASCNKTPDIFYVDHGSQMVYIIDVAVSVSAQMVTGFKEKKYKPVAEFINKKLAGSQYRDYRCKFFSAVLDQGLDNLDVALVTLSMDIDSRKKRLLRLLVYECNYLIRDFQNYKLSNDTSEKTIFFELKAKTATSEDASLVHPLPSLESLERLFETDIYKKACKEYVPKDLNYLETICDKFKEVTTEKTLFTNQLFDYPSQSLIKDSFSQMEKISREEFSELTRPKPSLHFMIALTERSNIQHDGKLDLAQINTLKRLIKFKIETRIGDATANKNSNKMKKLLLDLTTSIPDLDTKGEVLDLWCGKSKTLPGDSGIVKCRATIGAKVLNPHKSFLEEYLGFGRVDDKHVTKVKSLPFWNSKARDISANYILREGMKLSEERRETELEKPKKSGIESVDELLASQYEEIKPLYETINNCQAAYVSRQISEMCQSLLIQKKKEANNVQFLNKGDRGMFVITFPHRLLETRKTGSTVPFICLSIRHHNEVVVNPEIVEMSFDIGFDYILDVSRGMRLDTARIESLSHSYELYMSVMLGWFTSTNEKKMNCSVLKAHSIANGYLFYLCHSVHLRTGGLLDNLRYMFMDVTAERSNFKMFLMDNGKMALKNHIQMALYSRMRETLPQYSIASAKIKQRNPEYDSLLNEVKWGSLGVDNVEIPSLISQGYKFTSFMAATNEIVGLFFAVPKDLHGEFHKMVSLEKIPFEWQVKFNDKRRHLLNWEDVVKAIKKGGAEKQTVDLELVYHIGKWVNDTCLAVRPAELMKSLSKIRMLDSILSHKQFTSSHSCIRSVDEEGYATRNKVLLTTIERIDERYKSNPPNLWEFCIDCVQSEEPFRFVISPKGQRSKDDREIYIGNLESFSLRLVEKVFATICKFQKNEAIHIAGDRKFKNIQDCFKKLLNWSRQQANNKREKIDAKEKLVKIRESRKRRAKLQAEIDGRDWSEHDEIITSHVTQEESKIFEKITGMPYSSSSYYNWTVNEETIKEDEDEKRLIQLLTLKESDPNIVFLNGDRSKWSAADVCEKFCTYIDALKALPIQIRVLMKCILIKHDMKQMHVSKKLHEKYLAFEENEFNEFKEVCGNAPHGTIKGNWFQGMLNFTSSSFHAGAQEVSWDLIRTKLLRDLPTEFVGLCHSDDEIAFMGYGSYDVNSNEFKESNIFHQNPLETILLFHNIIGTLGCMNYSQKKTNIHYKVSEFVSLFLVWGDQQFPFMKHLATAISGLPGTGLDDDMYSALSQVMIAAMRGCPMSTLVPVLKMAQQRIDRMYSLGERMHNDVAELMKLPRQYLPLELGGNFLPGPLPLLLAGPSIHDVCIIKAALEDKLPNKELCMKVLKCFYALTPEGLIKSIADDDPLSQADQYTSSRLSGFQGMIFKNYLPKKKDELLERISSSMSEEKELAFMIKRPAASVLKPLDGDDALTYWRMVIAKPAWVRAVRKEGARGMAIKRAQWVKGEHVKLRYDDDWTSLKACFEKISDYIHDGTVLIESQIELLKGYVYNISSSTCAILEYLDKIYVKKKDYPDNSIRIAEFLNKPATYRDVRNDVRKVIAMIWDRESCIKEAQHVKFTDMLPEDIAKVKGFYMPTIERKSEKTENDKLKKFYKEVKAGINKGVSYNLAIDFAKSVIYMTEEQLKEFPKLVHDIYNEPSWVYKQFEEQQRTRVVITSASLPTHTVTERLIAFNTLRWGTFHITSGIPQVRMHPTMLPSDTARKDCEQREIAHTIGMIYKRLVQLRMNINFIRNIFKCTGLRMQNGEIDSLEATLKKSVQYALTSPSMEDQAKKLIAVAELAVLSTPTVASLMLVRYAHPIGAWTVPQRHIGGGKYEGNFEYKCWIGDSILIVTGDSLENVHSQSWRMIVNDSNIAHTLLSFTYRAIFNEIDHGFRKLMPTFSTKNQTEDKMCRVSSSWLIRTPSANTTYIPKVQILRREHLISGSITNRIILATNGLEILQKSKFDRKLEKMLSIKATNTKSHRCNDIEIIDSSSMNLVIDGVNFISIVNENLLTSFLSNSMETTPLLQLSKCVVVHKVELTEIEKIFGVLENLLETMPPRPDTILRAEEFPSLTEVVEMEGFEFGGEDDPDPFAAALLNDEEEIFNETEEYIDFFDMDAFDEEKIMNLNAEARELFMNDFHDRRLSKKDPYDHALDPRSSERNTTCEIYKALDDEETNSSGSSKVSFVEDIKHTPGGHLEEKLIYQALGLSGCTGPRWDEFAFYMLKKQSSFGSDWALKNTDNQRFLIKCWSILCRNIMDKAFNDSNFKFEPDDSFYDYFRIFCQAKRSEQKCFEGYKESSLDELIDLTYLMNDNLTKLLKKRKPRNGNGNVSNK